MKKRLSYEADDEDGPGRIDDQSRLIDTLKGIIETERTAAFHKRELVKHNLDTLIDLRIVKISIDQRAIDRY